jgi:pilus assembly protein CpaB
MRQIILLVLAIVAGIIAYFASVTYLNRKLSEYKGTFQTALILVADRDIPAGTPITKEMIDGKELPAVFLQQNAVPASSEANYILGLRALQTIRKGEVIYWHSVERSGRGIRSFSDTISSGKISDTVGGGRVQEMGWRAISIPVDIVASVTQMVVPGDRVDIIATFTFPSSKPDPALDTVTMTILQDVEVLATGKLTTIDVNNPAFMAQQARGGGALSAAYSTVSLQVTPEEAEILAFAVRRGGGNLVLSLRNRVDPTLMWKPQTINFDYIEKNISRLNLDRIRRRGLDARPPTEQR